MSFSFRMGGHPYLYNPPAAVNSWDPINGSVFNPKAVSQASFIQPKAKPKQDGPLLNFNRHPDSYLIQPYGQTDVTPMHKNTRKRVQRARKTQLALRVIELVGAIGLLVCAICLKISQGTVAWIVRIPPAADTLIVIYSIYHLASSSKNRTPTNSASYHGFATIMDVGLIPFYVFITMLAHTNYGQAAGSKERWNSLLDSVDATNQIIQIVWLATTVMAVFHGFSLGIDLYLFIMYRKIMGLPPDMNPLEDDKLTRRKTKHKHKNSELTLMDEKHMSNMSGTTVGSRNVPGIDTPNRSSRPISFAQSRTGGDSSFSPHNPKTARMSQTNLAYGMYQQGNMATSHMNLHHREHSIADSAYSNRTSQMPNNPNIHKRSSVVSSMHSYEGQEQQHNSQEDLRADNWFVVGDGSEEALPESPYAHHAPNHRLDSPNSRTHQKHLPSGHPLHMNPPTPRENPPPTPPPQPIPTRVATMARSPDPAAGYSHHMTTHSREDNERAHTMASDMTGSSHYSHDDDESEVSSRILHSSRATPSRQLYGDLASAMRGVRQTDVISPRPQSLVGSVHWAGTHSDVSSVGMHSNNSNSNGPRHSRFLESVSGTVVRRSPVSEMDEEEEEEPRGHRLQGSYDNGYGKGYGRVVSRTGVDVMDYGADLGMMGGRRRDVSGKIAEEGRGGAASGGWFAGGLFRRASGMKS
ncbi:hypothetical protein BT63DRAFT_440453 [Microthyrium microscopicum]|uniref:Uncharacterized protein n=1 Tax=Microthyrium microscopicum TaxID=703497 RepID=A0A6A6UAV4_9PEZI|nr:hypothetical protein BT63DRAFT_440453 [Microthyrium microscopicum]